MYSYLGDGRVYTQPVDDHLHEAQRLRQPHHTGQGGGDENRGACKLAKNVSVYPLHAATIDSRYCHVIGKRQAASAQCLDFSRQMMHLRRRVAKCLSKRDGERLSPG